MSDEKMYHVYFKDGNKASFTNFFQFYYYQDNMPKDKIEKLTVEELWVDLQKAFMEKIQEKIKNGDLRNDKT